MNWSAFWNMGGFAFYVWTSYALAAVVLVLNVVLPLNRKRTVMRDLRRRRALEEQR